MLNVKAIPGEFQHALVIVDLDMKIIRKVVRKTWVERKKISFAKDVWIRKQFEENVMKLVDGGAQNFIGHFINGVLKACDDVCQSNAEENMRRHKKYSKEISLKGNERQV